MSSSFQKDLYLKKGSNFSIWDGFIALGLVSLGTGFYYRHKEKKLSVGSKNSQIENHKHIENKKDKIPTASKETSGSAIDKLGL